MASKYTMGNILTQENQSDDLELSRPAIQKTYFRKMTAPISARAAMVQLAMPLTLPCVHNPFLLGEVK